MHIFLSTFHQRIDMYAFRKSQVFTFVWLSRLVKWSPPVLDLYKPSDRKTIKQQPFLRLFFNEFHLCVVYKIGGSALQNHKTSKDRSTINNETKRRMVLRNAWVNQWHQGKSISLSHNNAKTLWLFMKILKRTERISAISIWMCSNQRICES